MKKRKKKIPKTEHVASESWDFCAWIHIAGRPHRPLEGPRCVYHNVEHAVTQMFPAGL